MKDQYQALYTTFRWWVPQRFNIAEECCRRWTANSTGARRIAMYAEDAYGQREVWTFGRLQEYANRLSNGLRRTGVQRGDRVAIALPQRPETLVAHIAVYQLGAISVPLSPHLEASVFEQRLRDSEARIALVDEMAAEALLPAVDRCPMLRQAIGVDLDDERVLPWRSLIARQESVFDMLPTAATDPAMLLYTAGTTGAPKGVLLPHSALMGSLPGFVASHDWFPGSNDVLWTPSDWGQGHGLFQAVLPGLYFGQPIVGRRGTVTAQHSLQLLERYQISHASIMPASLAQLVQEAALPVNERKLGLRSIAVTGAPLGAALFEQCRQVLGVIPNEAYGQTEVGTVIGQSHEKWPPRAGSMGRAYPGHQVAIADTQGHILAPGDVGEIVVNRYDSSGHGDPAFFLGYWRGEETGRPSGGTWHRTGDMARVDEDGYYWYMGRAEDVFMIGTHRVVPETIEAALKTYPGIVNAAVVGVHDAAHATQIKAYVVRASLDADSLLDDQALAQALRSHLRSQLPAYEVPHLIEFVGALPLTTTGAVHRHALRQREEPRARNWTPAQAQAIPAQ